MLESDDHYQTHLAIIYNLYAAVAQHEIHMTSFSQMEQLASQLTPKDQTIHWIWMREPETYLPNKIMTRAQSWIAHNPTFQFILWTNLIDQIELDEWISNLKEDYQTPFKTQKIQVKFLDETMTLIRDFCRLYGNQITPSLPPPSTASTSSSSMLEIMTYLFDPPASTTTAQTRTIYDSLQTTTTTTITTHRSNNYKINRIFKVDMLRVIILMMLGGIYCDFNDTICFYPMKYLLTRYSGKYFVGTDYDVEHPIFRNNYFMYRDVRNQEFITIGLYCINKALNEYLRITRPDFIRQYCQLCVELITLLNQHATEVNTQLSISSIQGRNPIAILPWFLQIPQLRQLIQQDPLKDNARVTALIGDILEHLPMVHSLGQRLRWELDAVDLPSLKNGQIKQKLRHRHPLSSEHRLSMTLPLALDPQQWETETTTYQFYDYFLLRYAVHMTVGDLILSTNFAYMEEVPNLIPYSRSNRLSTISMLTHIYDGTSYGLTKNYETHPGPQGDPDLRQEFL